MTGHHTVEVWRKVPGHACMVSSEGRVFGVTKIIKAHLFKGYFRVQVKPDGVQPPRRNWPFVGVHILVALAFVGPKPSPRHEVAHWDGLRTHNRPHNLRWALPLDQAADRLRHGRTVRGTRVANAVLTNSIVRKIRSRYANRTPSQRLTYESLAVEYGVSKFAIYRVVKRIGWRHVT